MLTESYLIKKGNKIYMNWMLRRNLQRQCTLGKKFNHLLNIIMGNNANMLLQSIFPKMTQKNDTKNFENDMQHVIAIATVKPSILSSSQFTEKYATTIMNSFGLISPEIDIDILKPFSSLAASYFGMEAAPSIDAVSFFKKCLMAVHSLIGSISYALDWMVHILKIDSFSSHSTLGKVDCEVIEILVIHEKEDSISQKALSFLCQIESVRGVVDSMPSIYEDYPTLIISVNFELKHNEKIQILGGKILVKLFSMK